MGAEANSMSNLFLLLARFRWVRGLMFLKSISVGLMSTRDSIKLVIVLIVYHIVINIPITFAY